MPEGAYLAIDSGATEIDGETYTYTKNETRIDAGSESGAKILAQAGHSFAPMGEHFHYGDETAEAPPGGHRTVFQGRLLEDHTNDELRELAAARGVEVAEKAKKAELVEALKEAAKAGVVDVEPEQTDTQAAEAGEDVGAPAGDPGTPDGYGETEV